MKIRQLIRTNGQIIDLPRPQTIAEICALIGADTLDVVALRHLGEPLHVMLVDDNGWETEGVVHGQGRFEMRPVRPRKPINLKATEIYLRSCAPGTTHQIVGDVVVMPDNDFA